MYHPGSMNQDRKREQKQRRVEKGERGNIEGLTMDGEDTTHLEIVLQKENDLSFFPRTNDDRSIRCWDLSASTWAVFGKE